MGNSNEPASEEPLHVGPPSGPERGPLGAFSESLRVELRRLAARALAGERSDITLQPTALVHEAWLRLLTQRTLAAADEDTLLAAAAVLMRRILVEHARARRRLKRGGGWARVALASIECAGDAASPVDVLVVDEALEELHRRSERQATIIELRVFGGLEFTSIARTLSLSRETVHREWRFAQAWLRRRLADQISPESEVTS